jgi:Bacteriophage HK97-gp10, putative tail-component
MATKRQARSYAKMSELRKKLKTAPDLVEKYIRPAMINAAEAVKSDMISLTPEDTGDLRARMTYRLSPDGMAALIGPNADMVDVARRFKSTYGRFGVSASGKVAGVATMARIADIGSIFYFRFLDSGTKGFSGTYKRDDGTVVQADIPAMPALHIRQRALDANDNYTKGEVAIAVKKALTDLANRGGA